MDRGDGRHGAADLRTPLQRETPARIGYRKLVSVDAGASVRQAVEIMQRHEVGCVVVLDGSRLAGIFTERSLIVRVLGVDLPLDTPVAEVMTANPIVAAENEPVHVVLARMHIGAFRHIPVVNDAGEPVGTMSVKRAVHFLADHLPEAIYNLADDPDRVPETPEGG
jgi:CBS domain-containing protein